MTGGFDWPLLKAAFAIASTPLWLALLVRAARAFGPIPPIDGGAARQKD